AVVAAGGDPRSFGGQNLVEELFEYVDSQTGEVNNPKDPDTFYEEAWCIMALISAGVSKSSQTIKNMVEFLKQQQNNDGGWGYAKGVSSDVDCTAAVTLALLVAGESTSSQVIQDALNFIKNNQGSGGGFISWGSENIYSTTWVVWALNAANEDPTSNNWKKNGNSPIDFILSKQQADGSYSSDIYVTACAIIALLGSYPPVKILTSVVKEVDISKMLTFQSQARSILETEGDVNKAYELLAEAGYLPETPPKLPKSLYDRLAEIYGPNLERYPTIEGRILLLKSFGIEFLQS
ncbi:MAG: prenyltransferase/squalene oxidase repeat-containing protein, partial [Candidatus Hecatellaceae archaeon]